jgi:hypothetical protein
MRMQAVTDVALLPPIVDCHTATGPAGRCGAGHFHRPDAREPKAAPLSAGFRDKVLSRRRVKPWDGGQSAIWL